jgi:hypothetical protein
VIAVLAVGLVAAVGIALHLAQLFFTPIKGLALRHSRPGNG